MTTREKSSLSSQPSGAQEPAILRSLAETFKAKARERERQGTGVERQINVAAATVWLAAAEMLATLASPSGHQEQE